MSDASDNQFSGQGSNKTQHLIHIGFPKTGSTFLQRWFATHPELRYQEGAIAGFYTIFELVRAVASGEVNSYLVTSTEAISVPLPTWGLGLYFPHGAPLSLSIPEARREACHLLRSLFPNAKVLIVTRGFRSVLFSLYSQFVREGGRLDFEDWLERPRLEWDYNQAALLYKAAFPGQVIILPYEKLAADSETFLAEIADKLGVNRFSEQGPLGVNRALRSAELRWYPRLARAFNRIPYIRRWHYKVFVPLAFGNHLAWLIRSLDYLFPSLSLSSEDIPESALAQFKGSADFLSTDPAYAPYHAEYLISQDAAG